MIQNVKRVLFLGLGVLAAAICVSPAAAQVPSGFGNSPIFDEEFNENSLNPAIWTHRGDGTVKHECYIDSSAVTVANGYARIHIYTANNSKGIQTNYCGAITTENGSFFHTYGYWEVNARFQYKPGMQCGFWVNSPSIRSPIINNPQQSGVEMDVFEHIQSADRTSYDHAVWWNGDGVYSTGTSHVGTQSNLADGNFHTFGVAWTPGSLTFYVDAVQTWHLSASDAAISNIPEYIILDTELPSASGIPPAGYGPLGSSTNAYMDVDYVRVYPYSMKTTSTTLSPTADAYVQDGAAAATNFLGSQTLPVKKDAKGYNQRSYLKFDLSRITAPVLQATLYLTPTAVGGDKTVTVASYVNDNSWSESRITWNTQPAVSAGLSAGVNYAAGILTNFDVTAVAAAGKTFSLQIAGDTQTAKPVSVTYASRANNTPTYCPRLVIISAELPAMAIQSRRLQKLPALRPPLCSKPTQSSQHRPQFTKQTFRASRWSMIHAESRKDRPMTQRALARLLFVCFFLTSLAVAQSPQPTDQSAHIRNIEKAAATTPATASEPGQTLTIDELLAKFKVPGISIALIENFHLIWAKGYGVIEAGSKTSVTTKTLFQAGSISKPVAATAALSLVQKGSLHLDTNVNDQLKSWKVPDNEFTVKKKSHCAA